MLRVEFAVVICKEFQERALDLNSFSEYVKV